MSRLATVSVVLLALASPCLAQEIIKADIKTIDRDTTKSPDFDHGGKVKEIRSKPRDWVQIDITFEVESNNRNSDFVEGVEVRYYVLPEGAPKETKKLYSTTINHVDVLKDTELHSAIYLSPNSLARIFGKDRAPNPRGLWVAVEIHAGGKMVGYKVTDGESSRWWRRTDVPTDSAMLRPKHKTPFAHLFYDAYAEVRD